MRGQSLESAPRMSNPRSKTWKRPCSLTRTHFESRVTLEQVFYLMDRLSEADREAKRLLALPGREAAGELLRGQIRFQLSDPAGAAGHFERALRHPGAVGFHRRSKLLSQATGSLPAQDRAGRPRLAIGCARLTDNAHDPKTALAPVPLRPPGSNSHRSGHLCRGPFVSGVTAHGARASPVRRRRPNAPRATLGSSATRTRAATPTRTFARTNCRRSMSLYSPIVDPSDTPRSRTPSTNVETASQVETRVDGKVYQTIVDYAFGSGNRGVSLVGHDQEGEFVECRLSFYPDDVGWDVTPGQALKPDHDLGLIPGQAHQHRRRAALS